MKNWFMLTLVGSDKPGIVAKVTQVLYENHYNLGETSMLRLGGNFSIMMMVNGEGSSDDIRNKLSDVCKELGFHLHIDTIEGLLHQHQIPNVKITVSGADREGIIAQVTGSLYKKGFNILNLDSDVAGTVEHPIYIMHIEGIAAEGAESISELVSDLSTDGVDISVYAIDTMVG